jgi:hypothetical protein
MGLWCFSILSVSSADVTHSHTLHYIHRRLSAHSSPLKLNERVELSENGKWKKDKEIEGGFMTLDSRNVIIRPTWNLF